LTDNTNEILHYLVVQPADDPKHTSARVFPEGGEMEKNFREIKNHVVESVADSVDPCRLIMHYINPEHIVAMALLHDHNIDGYIHHADVLKCLEKLMMRLNNALLD
jgi:hypothetical protein